jgi:nondiscriminating glutamyl-tRNA synthetase
MRKERVRFAPSPTGLLHVGNARTALFNYLFAAQNEGLFVLRIEDTDEARSSREHERQLIDALHWLELYWDEGPDAGGKYGPYRQSERLDLYRKYAGELLEKGKAYYCYCTDAELDDSRHEMLHAGVAPRYPGTCRNLSDEERRALERSGRSPCIRFLTPDSGPIRFQDRIHGPMTFNAGDIGDFVLMRSNGMPAYNFAAVVDDFHMGITIVIRGEDHLANTPRQVLLYREFGWDHPVFAHHALLMGPDRSKLSKRHGETSIEAFREMGFFPDALTNYLALLGGNLVNGREIFSTAELIETFSLKKAGKSAAVFSLDKLLWVNQQHLRAKSPQELSKLIVASLERSGYSFTGRTSEWTDEVVSIIAENIRIVGRSPDYAPIFFDDLPEYSESVRERFAAPEVRDILSAFLKRFELSPSSDKKDLSVIFDDIQREFGVVSRELFLPLRMALTGMESGPELDRILPLLSPSVILKRLSGSLCVAMNKEESAAGVQKEISRE